MLKDSRVPLAWERVTDVWSALLDNPDACADDRMVSPMRVYGKIDRVAGWGWGYFLVVREGGLHENRVMEQGYWQRKVLLEWGVTP